MVVQVHVVSTARKLLRIPERVHTLDELMGTMRQLDDVQNVVVIVEDGEGITTLTINGITAERMNWMLDRAKMLIHRAD